MNDNDTRALPSTVQAFIARVIKKMRYRKKVRTKVRAELEAHFEDALAECEGPEERNTLAQTLIQAFGDAKILAVLIRRAKKRCRPLWAKVMIRTAQATGLCVLYIVLCMSRLYIGSPTIKVDTITKINTTMRQGRDESLNALPGIQAAADLLTNQPKDLWEYPTYVRTSETDFMLYSWGENLKDDQGSPSTNANGKVRQFGSQGDWVFWPVMN